MTGQQKNWRLAGGVGYLALFFYIFMLQPVAPQVAQGEITVNMPVAGVTRLVSGGDDCGSTLPVQQVKYSVCPFHTQMLRLAAGRPVSAASLFMSSHQVKMWMEKAGSGAVLKAEMTWTVRGGRLGKVLDNLLSRPAREQMLHESLAHFRELAEASYGRVQRASLGSSSASLN